MKEFHRLLADRLRRDVTEFDDALHALATGRAATVVVGGKMTAGKDTVAPELTDVVPGEVVFPRYGNLMRADLDPGLEIVREHYAGIADVSELGAVNADIVAARVASAMKLREPWARELVDLLAPEMVASGGTLTTFDRTEGLRIVLQNLGEPWRCQDDEDYWARPAAVQALTLINEGKSVILTGGRYRPDVDIPRFAGSVLVRLDVTRETQLRRLSSRDGIAPSPETIASLDHRGETALDDYEHFDIRVDNDLDGEEHLARVIATVRGQVWENIARRGTVAA